MNKLIITILMSFSFGLALGANLFTSEKPASTPEHNEVHTSRSAVVLLNTAEQLDEDSNFNTQLTISDDVHKGSLTCKTNGRYLDKDIYEQILFAENLNDSIELLQAEHIAQFSQIEDAILDRLRHYQVGSIDEIANIISTISELDITLREPELISHVLESVLIAGDSQNTKVNQLLFSLHDGIGQEHTSQLLNIIDTHSHSNPMAAWQALSLVSNANNTLDVISVFDDLRQSSNSALVRGAIEAWLNSNGTFDFNDPKNIVLFNLE